MYTPENGESEPDWVKTERKHFSEFRDANKVKGAQLFRIRMFYQLLSQQHRFQFQSQVRVRTWAWGDTHS